MYLSCISQVCCSLQGHSNWGNLLVFCAVTGVPLDSLKHRTGPAQGFPRSTAVFHSDIGGAASDHAATDALQTPSKPAGDREARGDEEAGQMLGNPGAWDEREKCGSSAGGEWNEPKPRSPRAPTLRYENFTFKPLQSQTSSVQR